MADIIQLRRDTEANWTAVNPVLAQGEIGIAIDLVPPKMKIGNGINVWNAIDYFAGGTASSLADLTDVDLATPPTASQVLVYDATTETWKAGTVSGGGGVGISSAVVNENGDLIITLTDSTTINAGHVVGEQGPPGDTGATGADGAQGSPGTPGADGKSAYQIWLDNGNTGTEEDFLAALKGEPGDGGAVDYIDLTTAPADGEILVYDGTSGKFKPNNILIGLEAALAAINGV
ncbi:collagen-like protein [Sporomusa termitida]|uniref:Major tropism determinant N-terminal domain-containing protein n=1 Tax=Sporomusa termitida TaxID=2377 RepID=A0A517DS97_9FIRM|nr:collagen-like protein [Sporomusa termitida]QDR80235.1 hypothetical protein SPTER_15540 [Sporomusa termitida]